MNGLQIGLALGVIISAAPSLDAVHAQTVEPIEHWSIAATAAALEALKATDIRTSASEGRPVVTARTRDGLNVGVYAKACDPAPPGVEAVCHGLEAIISFDPGPKVDHRALTDRLNHQFALGKFLAEPDGTIRLSRYLVFDGAVSPANLRAELASLFNVGALTAQTLWPETARK